MTYLRPGPRWPKAHLQAGAVVLLLRGLLPCWPERPVREEGASLRYKGRGGPCPKSSGESTASDRDGPNGLDPSPNRQRDLTQELARSLCERGQRAARTDPHLCKPCRHSQ